MNSNQTAFVLVEYLGDGVTSDNYCYPREVAFFIKERMRESIVFYYIGRYYLRIPISLDSNYEFSVFTAGFQNISYRLFLKIDDKKMTDICCFGKDKSSSYEEIQGRNYGLITPGRLCHINGTGYYLHKSEKPDSLFNDHFSFRH